MASKHSGSDDRAIYWVLALVVGGVIAFLGLVWAVGLLDIPRDDPGAKAFASVLALLGVLVTASITLMRVWVERQANQRAERRLEVETALRAVSQLGTPSGMASSSSQQSGALLALVGLGRVEFALSLLAELWPKSQIGLGAARQVVDAGLCSTDVRLQRAAASLIWANAGRLVDTDVGVLWPRSADPADAGWGRLEQYTRTVLISEVLPAIADRLTAVDDSTFGGGSASTLSVICHLVINHERDHENRASAGVVLQALSPHWQRFSRLSWSRHEVSREDLRSSLRAAQGDVEQFSSRWARESAPRVEKWAARL